MNYPFIPKSTTKFEPGQFWPIPLSNGEYCCGVVLAKLSTNDKIETRVFYAALLDWHGNTAPTKDSIKGCKYLKAGALHIKAISEINSQITGQTNLENLPSSPCEYLDEIPTLGYSVLNILAEKYFAK